MKWTIFKDDSCFLNFYIVYDQKILFKEGMFEQEEG
jgi:hypothetical protein